MAITLNDNLQISAPKIIDERLQVSTSTDLLTISPKYANMYVWVSDEKLFYYLNDSAVGDEIGHWTKVSGGIDDFTNYHIDNSGGTYSNGAVYINQDGYYHQGGNSLTGDGLTVNNISVSNVIESSDGEIRLVSPTVVYGSGTINGNDNVGLVVYDKILNYGGAKFEGDDIEANGISVSNLKINNGISSETGLYTNFFSSAQFLGATALFLSNVGLHGNPVDVSSLMYIRDYSFPYGTGEIKGRISSLANGFGGSSFSQFHIDNATIDTLTASTIYSTNYNIQSLIAGTISSNSIGAKYATVSNGHLIGTVSYFSNTKLEINGYGEDLIRIGSHDSIGLITTRYSLLTDGSIYRNVTTIGNTNSVVDSIVNVNLGGSPVYELTGRGNLSIRGTFSAQSASFSYGSVIATPSNNFDIVNKKYVDDMVASGGGTVSMTPASPTQSGYITTGTQSLGGNKSLIGNLNIISNQIPYSAEDNSFYTNLGTSFNSAVYSAYVQSDGKILVGGIFTTFNGSTRNRLVRLNVDGTEDASFYTNLGTGFTNNVFSINTQSDGKILVGGSFTSFNGNTRNRLLRLNVDGTEDTAFYANLGAGFNISNVNTINIQSDGKILVGGTFNVLNFNTRNSLIRLNSDGTEDTAFYSNMGTSFTPNSVNIAAIQSDGKILVGGFFTSFNGNTRNRLVRLNSDGTEDTAFYTNMGSAFDTAIEILDIKVQSDGKILVGGRFTSFNGNTRNRLIRLNSDGTEDVTFYTNMGSAFDDGVYSLNIQSDGKIIVGGGFTTFSGNTRNRLVRLNVDGTEDITFYTNLGTAFNNFIYYVNVQSDGKILLGGAYITLNGTTRNRLVRLNVDDTNNYEPILDLESNTQGLRLPISNNINDFRDPRNGLIVGLTGSNDGLYYYNNTWNKVLTNQGTQSINGSLNVSGTINGTVSYSIETGVLQSVTLGSDVINNNAVANTLQDVTGLSFLVVAGSLYYFNFIIFYTSAATTTGSRWSVNGPGTASNLSFTSEYTLTSTTTTRNANVIGFNLPAGANATSAASGNRAQIEGYFLPDTSGTFIARFASEVSASAITAKAGSVVFFRKLT